MGSQNVYILQKKNLFLRVFIHTPLLLEDAVGHGIHMKGLVISIKMILWVELGIHMGLGLGMGISLALV